MRMETFRDRLRSRAPLAGTFVKTPDIALIEVLARTELDFLCLDAEHSPFDRGGLDACLAIGRALDCPMLVRVGDGSPREILQALDKGALGVVVPHVTDVDKARAVARAAHFGHGGRGFAGSTRWAGYATRPMAEVLAQDSQTVVLAQIEEPEGVEACAEIAAVDGIDGLFLGPSDLSVAYGHDSIDNPDLPRALARVGQAARDAGKAFVSFTATEAQAQDWARDHGVHVFLVASEHSWLRAAANAVARGVHAAQVSGEQGSGGQGH